MNGQNSIMNTVKEASALKKKTKGLKEYLLSSIFNIKPWPILNLNAMLNTKDRDAIRAK